MTRDHNRDERRPLLPSDAQHFSITTTIPSTAEDYHLPTSSSQDNSNGNRNGNSNSNSLRSRWKALSTSTRLQTKHFLTSKTGHYSVLALVSLDVTAIFADLIIQLISCEGRISFKNGERASNVLGVVSLVFSCAFMLELIASVWAFGWRFFHSWFHCVDAAVILAGFVIDVLLKGILEEIGSLVVVLRLWRVLKIIEELSAGAEEQMDVLHERVETLEKENAALRRWLDVSSG